IVEQCQHPIQHCGAAPTSYTALWSSANTPYSIVEQRQHSIQHCGAVPTLHKRCGSAPTLHTALWSS
ncbi:hypothetical protein BgiBS90_015099, partial [Biomphalaria glabrata]